jgi:hypothetical protein
VFALASVLAGTAGVVGASYLALAQDTGVRVLKEVDGKLLNVAIAKVENVSQAAADRIILLNVGRVAHEALAADLQERRDIVENHLGVTLKR